MHRIRSLALSAAFLLVGTGCAQSPPEATSFLQGEITVSPEADSTGDFRDFEVLVFSNASGDIDTLAVAFTDSTGRFATAMRVPRRAAYPLIVSRNGQALAMQDVVVAADDTVSVRARFPLDGRRLRIVSRENAAWMAFENTKAQYNQMIVQTTAAGYDEAAVGRLIGQTSAIYWSLQSTYPHTLGAAMAAAEAVNMLEGWNDSLAVARALSVEPGQPGRLSLARAARRAAARIAGQDSALAVLDYFARTTDEEGQPALLAERVVARIDSLDRTQALVDARLLQARYPDSPWARWAERAIYEIETLQPGMEAPDVSFIDREGLPVSVSDYRDQYLMLEFFSPTNTVFAQEAAFRSTLLAAVDAAVFQALSVSLDPDPAVNDALFEGRSLPGRFVVDPDGFEGIASRAYNVNVIPTRILIDPDGMIVRKYAGATLSDLRDDLIALLGGSE